MAIVLIFSIRTVVFLFCKNLKGMIVVYFIDTPEIRKFKRKMQNKPNFDRRNDDRNENDDAHFPDNKNVNTNRKNDGG